MGESAAQMGGDGDELSEVHGMATVLMTGIERTVTVATDSGLTGLFGAKQRRTDDHYLVPEARLMELAIRDTRERVARGEIGASST